MPLDSATLERLTTIKNKPKPGTFVPQIGPLRYIEGRSRTCSKRGCASPTNYAVQGVPRCSTHALEEMNEMLINQGFRGVATFVESRPTDKPPHRIVSASVQARLRIGFALSKFECIHGINLASACNVCNSKGV